MAKATRILISAFIGSNNLGDEAVFLALIGQLNERLERSKLTAISIDPEKTRHLLSGNGRDLLRNVRVLKRYWLPIAILRNRVCIFGGGGIIQDQSSILNLFYFLAQIQFAKLMRKTVVLAFVGVGPLSSRIGKLCTKTALSGLTLCIVRDEGSKKLLDNLAVDGTEIICASDIALDLKCQLAVSSAGPIAEKYLLLSLRHWYSESKSMTPASRKSGKIKPGTRLDLLLTKLAQELTKFLEMNKVFQVVAVPFFGERDDLVHSALRVKLAARYRERFMLHGIITDPCQYLSLARSASCVIGMRLHALVLASLENTPMVALSYSAKTTAFMKQLDLGGHVIGIETEPAIGELADRLGATLANEEQIRSTIDRKSRKLRKLNQAAIAKLVKTLERA